MAAGTPQGTLSYAGIHAEGSFSVLRSGSCVPDPIQAKFPMGVNLPPYGDIIISYGPRRVIMRNCRLRNTKIAPGGNGRWQDVSFEDRRWAWQVPVLFMEKTQPASNMLAELIQLLGEPSVTNPRAVENRINVMSNGDPVIKHIEEILGRFGLMVSLDWDDRMQIYPIADGRDLPNDEYVMDYTTTYERPVIPQKLQVASSQIVYALDFVLQPVGLDHDGRTKVLDDLSYNPLGAGASNGFANIDPVRMKGIQARSMELAKRSLWKMYRIYDAKIRPPTNSTIDPRIFKNTGGGSPYLNDKLPDHMGRCLPLRTTRQIWNQSFGQFFGEPASVVGYFSDGKPGRHNNVDPVQPVSVSSYLQTPTNGSLGALVYQGGFHIDQDLGVVVFSEPMYLVNRTATAIGSKTYYPAQIVLRCGCLFKDGSNVPIRQFYSEQINHPDAVRGMAKTIIAEDLKYTVGLDRDTPEHEFKVAGRFFADQEKRKYLLGLSASVPNKGFRFDYGVDGRISAVRLERSDRGECSTQLDWQSESPTERLTYDEKLRDMRRRVDRLRLDQLEAEQARIKKAEKKKVQ